MKSKIILLVTIITILFSGNIIAQSFDKGDQVIAFGLGIGGNYGVHKTYTSQSPAIGFSYEKGMKWDAGPGIIGMGGYLGYKSLRYYEPFYVDYKWTYLMIGVRGAYHYEFTPNLDTYGGMLLSYDIVSLSDHTIYAPGGGYRGASGGRLGISLFVGGRYYFSDKWAAFLELGYGIAYLQLGAAYKF